jgi:hypothetical protein
MNLKTVIGLNGWKDTSEGIYVSPEDIDIAESFRDEYNNIFTVIYTKAGNRIKVLGNAYYILGIKEAKDAKSV